MARSSLNFVIDKFFKEIDAWHGYNFQDDQIMRIAQDFQQFGDEILVKVAQLVKTSSKKPSPAQLMQYCRDERSKEIESFTDNIKQFGSGSITSSEYAKSQGYETLSELVRAKTIEELDDKEN
tara:strand:+ start:72 stop:440 length:369 start_codon:yes stop_codon:yes gene_type:complete